MDISHNILSARCHTCYNDLEHKQLSFYIFYKQMPSYARHHGEMSGRYKITDTTKIEYLVYLVFSLFLFFP